MIKIRSWVKFTLLLLLTVPMSHMVQGQPIPPSPLERPDLYARVQDTLWAYLIVGNDTTDPNLITGSYRFDMVEDSICRVSYTFSEAMHNGKKLNLLHWVWLRSVNAAEDMLSFNSRTENFPLKAGDSLSFFRELRWFNARTQRQDTANFYSRDTLSFSVELVRASDSALITVIDKLGTMPRATVGRPTFFGTRPIAALPRYIVPAGLDGIEAFLRVRVHAGGSGDYHFTRTDGSTSEMCRMTENHDLMSFINYMNASFAKGAVFPDDEDAGRSNSEMMSVRNSGTGNSDITIILNPAYAIDNVAVVVHDAGGNTLPSPFSGNLEEARSIPYHFPSSGAYFINLVRGGKVLETEKITITK